MTHFVYLFNQKMAENFMNHEFEDTIKCSFYSISRGDNELDDLCEVINELIRALSQGYIWHRDEFRLYVSIDDREKKGTPAQLTSTTCFGDNIEDEWFIVYLVLQITSQHNDLVVQIQDNDGDFLLIEAADCLPSWANPETTENRMFIYQSEIHMIPPEIIDLDSNIDLQEAIQLVVQKSEETKAAKEIQEAILRRISFYPKKIKESQHRALVTLPVDIAALLTLKQSLISPIVTTYCSHDVLDEKCFKNVKFQNCITVPILFTKYLYAMLMHSKLPRIRNSPHNLQKKDNIIGWKLACGYEIIMNKLSEDIFSSTEYKRFINSLMKNGYFKNNIEGSKQYNELLEKAKKYFLGMECPITSFYSNHINDVKGSEEFITLKDSLTDKNNSEYEVDTDEWLNINPDELNTFLNTHFGKKLINCNNTVTPQFTSDLTNFLNQTSDFEGIEYVKEEDKDENQVEFDPDQFMNCVQKILNIVSSDNNFTNNDNSEFSEDEDIMQMEDDLDKELADKLKKSDINSSNEENIMKNLLQSIKEEGISGPSSNVLKNIAVSKTDLIDSDDD